MKKFFAVLMCVLMAMNFCAAFAEAEDVTLYVVDINTDHEAYDKMIAAFEAAHPGVKVETNHAVNDNAEIMSSLIAAGNTPNIFVSTPENTVIYAEYLYDWSQDADVLAQFDESYIAAVTEDDGAVYGLPNGCINVGLIYNADILAEAGYDSIPLTMSGFETMCADIYEKTGVVPFAVPGAEGWMLCHMMDAYIISKDQPGSVLETKFDSGEMKISEASDFENYWKMMDIAKQYTDGETMLEYNWEYACSLLANGSVAIITYGDWAYNAVTSQNADINLGFSSYPVNEDENAAVTPTSVNQVALLFENVENVDLAKELAVFITATLESAEYFAVGYGSVSCNLASADVDGALYNSLLEQSKEVAAAGRCVDRMQNYYPKDQGVDFMSDAGDAVQGYLIGLYTAEEATAMIDAAWPVAE